MTMPAAHDIYKKREKRKEKSKGRLSHLIAKKRKVYQHLIWVKAEGGSAWGSPEKGLRRTISLWLSLTKRELPWGERARPKTVWGEGTVETSRKNLRD